ncbi:hypothetical protein [Sneathiella limimaris]|uniref:hypothetical protein n=1 Tax=Sneathiella limimaris TaxID=1964213 RepID=UPI00146A11DE|nr:hypothetical protein [Sneathiella limimaris]
MLDRFTSTWVIAIFLIGIMFVLSFIPVNQPQAVSQSVGVEQGLDADLLNKDLSSVGQKGEFVETN